MRSLLVAAHRLGLVNSGQHVFINVDTIGPSDEYKPWEDPEATKEENEEAQEAFKALLTISLTSTEGPNPNSTFTEKVEEVAGNVFNVTRLNRTVNGLAAGFYDAALLYAKG